MEKPWKIKGMILAFLPKAAAPVTFQLSPPLSPVKPGGARKIPIIPKEVRRKPKNSSFEQKEPASPKVSCMGQVKKNKCKPKLVVQVQPPPKEEKKKVSIMKIFKGGKKVDVADHDDVHDKPGVVVQRVPSSSHIKKYASGRGGALEDFDWRTCQELEGEGKVTIPYVGAIEPRKEVNLWKRRNKGPPIPLEI